MTALPENWREKADFEKVKSELGSKGAHPDLDRSSGSNRSIASAPFKP